MPPQGAKPTSDEPAYHNRSHYLQVCQTVAYLIEAQQELRRKGNSADPLLKAELSTHAILTTLTAAMAHDIGHTGRGNPKDALTQKLVRFFNEDAAASSIYPLAKGVYGTEDLGDFFKVTQTYIRYTDPSAPRGELVRGLAAVRNGQTPDAIADYYMPADNAFWAGAAVLGDADILLSAAAGRKISRESGEKLNREAKAAGLNIDFTTAGSTKFFFDNIVGKDGFQSGAARAIFNPLYMSMREKNDLALKSLKWTREKLASPR